MINKLIYGFITLMLLQFFLGWFITYKSFNSGYKKGFDSGIEWERNIILEYVAPKISCDGDCDTV